MTGRDAALAPLAMDTNHELNRLLTVAEGGLEDAVNFWGVHSTTPTAAQVRKSSHAGLVAVRKALEMLDTLRATHPTPSTSPNTLEFDEDGLWRALSWITEHSFHAVECPAYADLLYDCTCDYGPIWKQWYVMKGVREASGGVG
jgi:hypothetical protein